MGKYEESRKELYLKLRKHRGAMKEIGRRTGHHRTYVYAVLIGKYNNYKIVKVASEVLKEKEEVKRLAHGTIHKNLIASS